MNSNDQLLAQALDFNGSVREAIIQRHEMLVVIKIVMVCVCVCVCGNQKQKIKIYIYSIDDIENVWLSAE